MVRGGLRGNAQYPHRPPKREKGKSAGTDFVEKPSAVDSLRSSVVVRRSGTDVEKTFPAL
jgi:hypothetical protein